MRKKSGRLLFLQHWHKLALLLAAYDVTAVCFSYICALWIRFDGSFAAIPEQYLSRYLKFIPIYAAICLVVFFLTRLYQTIWRYASINELLRALMASVVTSGLHIVGMGLLYGRMPISYYVFGAVIQFLLILGIRFGYRFIQLEVKKAGVSPVEMYAKRVMIIGAGDAGESLLRDAMRQKKENLKVCCIIDDNPNTWGRYIDGVPVVGGREDILYSAKKYDINLIFFAISRATAIEKRDILNICKETGCELKYLPGLTQRLSGVGMGDLREVAVEDLLGREPVRVDMEEIYRNITDKVVLITGGGGSIGSELCRQVAACAPRQLIVFDIYENNAYGIQNELKEKFPALNLKVLIGSVRDSRRMADVFEAYKPNVVYHAAAHKHVPLMEGSPCEAIKNNVIRTYKTAYAALCNGCERFVLISTDKAVNPTNIMGASKRLCEMVIQSFDAVVKSGRAQTIPCLFTHKEETFAKVPMDGHTEFVAVRFGNVLGSNGSVLPLFKRQIEQGGPVTVTHPDIIRYFMTIPEAVSLVMQAGVYAKGGEIFVLDMGAPMKIDELARNYIKLSGYKPDVDIPIVYTGLRPGEKLYEEKLMAQEGLQKTPNELIHIGSPVAFDAEKFFSRLQPLMSAAYDNQSDIGQMISKMVETYQPTHQGAEDATYNELVRHAVGTK